MPDFPPDAALAGDFSTDPLFPQAGFQSGLQARPGTAGDQSGTYQVLARKYRPRRFEDLIGQEAMVRTLANSFKSGRIAHAFMLTGVRGVGKTTTARLLARALTYESATIRAPHLALDPPGIHCASIIAGAHPDILEMDAASHTGVANMRDILEGSAFAPAELRKKIYIIDEVHMLSTAAFNSLLKTLEEPPAHVAFIFATTEIRKVPVTILSRCQRFDLRRVPAPMLVAHLGTIAGIEGAVVEPDALNLLARAAEGSVRDGLSLLDQAIVHAEDGSVVGVERVREMLGLADRGRLIDLFRLILTDSIANALTELADLYALGAEPGQILRDLLDICHAASKLRALGPAALDATDAPAERKAQLLALAGGISAGTLSRLWQILLKGMEECQRAPDALAAAEMCLIRLAAAAHLPGPEEAAALLRRAAEGQGGSGPAADQGGGSGPGAKYDAPERASQAVRAPDSRSGAREPGTVGVDQTSVQPVPSPDTRLPANRRDIRSETASPEKPKSPSAIRASGGENPSPAPSPPDPGDRRKVSEIRRGEGRPESSAHDIGFINLVSLLEQARELTLAVELENFALGGKVNGLDISFGLAPGAPRDLLRRLASALEEATGETWRISLDPHATGETLAAARIREREEEIARIRAHPAIAAMLGQFPELAIVGITRPEVPVSEAAAIAPDEAEDSDGSEDPHRAGDNLSPQDQSSGSDSSAEIISLRDRRKTAKG